MLCPDSFGNRIDKRMAGAHTGGMTTQRTDMSAEETLRLAAERTSAPDPDISADAVRALGDLLEDLADAVEVLAEMYENVDDAAVQMLRGYESAMELARIINGDAR